MKSPFGSLFFTILHNLSLAKQNHTNLTATIATTRFECFLVATDLPLFQFEGFSIGGPASMVSVPQWDQLGVTKAPANRPTAYSYFILS